MDDNALFTQIGQALYGDHFRAPLAIDLEVEKQTVGNWAKGKSRIPPNVWLELLELLREREQALPALIAAAGRCAGPAKE